MVEFNCFCFCRTNPISIVDLLGCRPKWKKVVKAYDEDIFFDDTVGSVTLELEIDTSSPLGSTLRVKDRSGDIWVHNMKYSRLSGTTAKEQYLILEADVTATMEDTGPMSENMSTIASSVEIGAASGALVGFYVGGTGGAGAGGVAGGGAGIVVGVIKCCIPAFDYSVTVHLAARLTCTCKANGKWVVRDVIDLSDNVGDAALRDGDLYLKITE